MESSDNSNIAWIDQFIDRREIIVKNRLKELREENSLNQTEMGKALDVSRQTIHAIEVGKYNPSLELAFKISRYFKKPIEKIFEYEE